MSGLPRSPTLLAGTPTGRFLRYATLQILAVAVLASFTAPLAIFFPDPLDVVDVLLVQSPATFAAGTGAVATAWTLKGLEVAALVFYVAVPLTVAWWSTARGDRRRQSAALWAGVALLGLPWFAAWRELLRSPVPTHRVLGGLVALGGPALVVAASRVVARRPVADGDAAERRPAEAPTGPPPGVFLGFLLAASVLAVPLVIPNPTAGLVEGASGPFGDGSPTVANEHDRRPTGEGLGVLSNTRATDPGLFVVARDSVPVHQPRRWSRMRAHSARARSTATETPMPTNPPTTTASTTS